MAQHTKIEWCDHTFNPWEGCQKVGPGCDHCYAETRNSRFNGGQTVNWGPGAPRRRTSVANWQKPLQWQAKAAEFMATHGRRQRVFCASLADVFDNAVDPAWRLDLFRLIAKTPDLDWLLLTKRIGNAKAMMDAVALAQPISTLREDRADIRWQPMDNVWIGATITSQEEADRDIPKLLDVPAHMRFLSMEPLLGPVYLPQARAFGLHGFGTHVQGVDWVIVGGESGPGSRPMHPAWARSLRDQCAEAGVPFLFKQWGEWLPWLQFGWAWIEDSSEQTRYQTTIWQCAGWEDCGYPLWCDMQDNYGGGANGPDDSDQIMGRVGKKAAGRLLDGVEHNGFPPPPNRKD